MILQILGSYAEVYDMITQKRGSFNKLLESIELIDKYEIPTQFMILINELNEDYIDDIKLFLGSRDYAESSIYPPNEYASDKMHNSLYDKTQSNIIVSINNYQYLEKYHSCLFRHIFISEEGKVHPCMMMRDFILGNLKEEKLYEVFAREEYRKFWELSKNKIHKCTSCERKLMCFDCRAIEYYATADLNAMEFCGKIV